MLPEAEELLVKAWKTENLRHEGRYWNLSIPLLRPRPYQRPHPPLVRACLTEESLVEMAELGRPVLINIQTIDTLRHRLALYRDTMLESGYAESEVEKALDETWVMRNLYVADSDGEALETATRALKRFRGHLLDARTKYNPGGAPRRDPGQAPPPGEIVEHAFLAGSPRTVAAQIGDLRDAGVRNLMLNANVGQMPQDQVERSLRLFGEKVLPIFHPT